MNVIYNKILFLKLYAFYPIKLMARCENKQKARVPRKKFVKYSDKKSMM